MILAFGDLLIFIALTFVGDYTIVGIPSFLFVWIALIVYRKITLLDVQHNELKLQQIIFILFLPYLFIGIIKSDPYYFSFLQTILYINIFPILSRFILNNYSLKLIVIFFLFMTSLVLIFGGGNRLDSNSVFIFGPNIMYRIYGVVFFSFYYIVVSKNLQTGKLLLLVFILSFVCLMSTGSRGGTIIFMMELFSLFYFYRKKTVLKYVLLTMIAAVLYFIIQYWDLISEVLGRAVYFDTTADSENTRLTMIDDFLYFLDYESTARMLFGFGNNNHYYPKYYPHNIIIESIVYHGLIFFGFIVLLSSNLIRRLFRSSEIRSFTLIFSPILVGSMVSGSFLDNYTLIALVFYSYIDFFTVKNHRELSIA